MTVRPAGAPSSVPVRSTHDCAGSSAPSTGRSIDAVRDLERRLRIGEPDRVAELEEVRLLAPVDRDVHAQRAAVVAEQKLLGEEASSPRPLDPDARAQRTRLAHDDALELHRVAGPRVGDHPVAPGVGRVVAHRGARLALGAREHIEPGRLVEERDRRLRSRDPARHAGADSREACLPRSPSARMPRGRRLREGSGRAHSRAPARLRGTSLRRG